MTGTGLILPGVHVALVHDWLTGMRGGEKVLEVLCELFPGAPLFTLLHNPGAMSPVISAMDIRTSFIDRLPFKEQKYRNYLPLMPSAVESFDLRDFDLVVSTSHAVAKGVVPRPGAFHVCYCHTPMRYVWDQYDEYFGKGRAGSATRLAMAAVAPYLRRWDVSTSSRVDRFIANSRNVRERIMRIYGRSADIIHAPVDTDLFTVTGEDKGYYLMVTAFVPYKRVDIAIDAFNALGEKLLIVGKGPELASLRRRAQKNISFLGWRTDRELADLYGGCRAVVFPGEEDFGIVPLEAMACGKPVIAYARGGALETVVADGPVRTGLFFDSQTVGALTDAVRSFDASSFNPRDIRRHAESFNRPRFSASLASYIRTEYVAFRSART